jgi:hypothetical protein
MPSPWPPLWGLNLAALRAQRDKHACRGWNDRYSGRMKSSGTIMERARHQKGKPSRARAGTQTTPKTTKLPEWVIGCYDGPKDTALSTREGFRR